MQDRHEWTVFGMHVIYIYLRFYFSMNFVSAYLNSILINGCLNNNQEDDRVWKDQLR